MNELVCCQIENNIATITLQNGKANAISHEVINDLNSALDKAEQANAVVVLTGQPGMLSAGYDLKIMQESMQSAMALVAKGSALTRRMLAFPYPIIVACSGHAVAKGAFLLLAADYRIGVAGDFKIGLNEVAIGMTMHHAGVELARGRLAPVFFNRSVILAEMFTPQDAENAGFLDKLVSEQEFWPTVNFVAQAMTKLNMTAHHQTKLKARAELLQVLDENIEKDRHSSL
ncbi:crotonase/enoyl-CoA hydratase family protein [Paraglaciecola aquimarina]|uniref:Crotonase/enoyl-CoA hydratase family protein n=1 Tax=Paraglaciecola algarum TaxID=3050085 RepID=A0ABS9D6M1_9ALTE|nr:crotonase/enoyl-CoA hydratase family protein [Paraglaciecola sp. G1-23]MCF2948612.1 crotonase/enoyl-CoA hydratase family protein [Paraglaciecola sp. G1-23]